MTSVSPDDVRDVLGISQADVPDEKIAKMIKRAEVALKLELGREINHTDCTDAEKEAITVLAAIHAICYLTGGSAVGLSFSVGDQNVSVLDKVPPLEILQADFERILNGLKGVHVGKA
ncbi:MAG: hypothetical protein QW270_02610 [Candidatus Bathyarchaeia archaeon]